MRKPFLSATIACVVLLGACSSSSDTTNPADDQINVVSPIATQSAVAGVAFSLDATRSNTTFSDPRKTGLTYAVSFAPAMCGLVASGGMISGTPLAPGAITVTITATDGSGRTATHSFSISVQRSAAIVLAAANTPQGATVGTAFSYDATKGGTTFTNASNAAMSYAVTFAPAANGLTASQGRISGVPTNAGIVTATIVASDASGNTASNEFPIVLFSSDLVSPTLPVTSFSYSDATSPLPAHYLAPGPPGPGGAGGMVIGADNTPATNAITNAGATLGRVLFYDRRLSINDRVSCASCHQPQAGFADTARLSRGFDGGLTGRHSMGLANARFYARGRFFWDERASSAEDQVLRPIQDPVEMGMSLSGLVAKVSVSSFYPALFQSAFGTADVTSDRIARALAQFVRSLVSGTSRFDQAFVGAGPPNFAAVFTPDELAGQQLFNGPAGCAQCHGTAGFISDNIHNTGLDATITDAGAGGGRFKAPSLKNIAVRPPYMHDGRFQSLEQVVDFYNTGVQNNPNLDQRLRGPGGLPQRLNLSTTQRNQIVAFLRTLTDDAFLVNPKFGNPFNR